VKKAERVGAVQPEKRRLRGDLIAAFHYVNGAFKKDGENIFSRACCDRTRSYGFKLRKGRFRLYIWKAFFTMRVVDAPSLETFKARLGGALSNVV